MLLTHFKSHLLQKCNLTALSKLHKLHLLNKSYKQSPSHKLGLTLAKPVLLVAFILWTSLSHTQ